MIARLRGELLETNGNAVVVDAGGVGYEVVVPDSVLVQLPSTGERVDILTRQIFREDGVSLYGFLEAFQRRMFDLLLEVKGCGPKVALSLLGQLGEDTVASSIAIQDAKALCRASGVGPRLAERIIVELRDKVQEVALERKIANVAPARTKAAPADELVDALLALGYRRSEAETAAASAREGADDVQDQIKLALRSLQR